MRSYRDNKSLSKERDFIHFFSLIVMRMLCIFCLLSFFPLTASEYMTPYKKGEYFLNKKNETEESINSKKIFEYLTSYLKSSKKEEFFSFFQRDLPVNQSKNLHIQWIGHASFLIQINGMNILVDPVYADVYPLFGGVMHVFKRQLAAGISLKELPFIHAVLISHNHYDHLEEKTLLKLLKKNEEIEIFVPLGLGNWCKKRGFKNIHEHTWWQSYTFLSEKDPITITATPARHSSCARDGMKSNESLWCGWVISGDFAKDNKIEEKMLYFAGDTSFDREMFNQIKNYFSYIDISLLPIAPEKELDTHLNVKQALNALEIIGGQMIPMHYLAYRMDSSSLEKPLKHLKKEIKKRPYLKKDVIFLKIGQSLDIE